MLDWMRSSQAQYFTRQLSAKLEAAHDNLVATCNKSSDPKVTAAVTLWSELETLVRFLQNSRKESAGDE